MKDLLLTMAFYGALSSALPVVQDGEQAAEKDMEFAKKFIEHYYPDTEPTSVVRNKFRSSVPAEKIRQMQAFWGLEVTGKLDSNTLDAMKKPRCGVPDIGEYKTFAMSPKWRKRDLTYRIQNYTPDMNTKDVDHAIERAWKLWSDVTPLTFTRVYGDSADIEISFASGSHGDYIPFDGPGQQLAHAFSPAYGGNVHFDEAETWTKDLKGTNLFLVAAHEFGHSLGLHHSDVLGALMFSTYQPVEPQNLKLHRDDTEGIQQLYGTPGDYDGGGDGDNDLSPTNIPEVILLTDLCDPHLAFDAVTTLRGEILFFKDSFMWRKFPHTKEIEKNSISSFWVTLSSSIDAAYEVEEDDMVYLFKGSKYWATKANIMEPGFPENIHKFGFPQTVEKVDAALYDENSKKIYFFSGDQYWRYDKATNSMEEGYPRKIVMDFDNMGSQVDAALQHNGRFYLFSGSIQYEFDSKTKQFLDLKKSNNWFHCK
uniref:Stromelysin-1-like n=1 Tax=Pogona vitticeps TaxID=103695 RepID=A0ABM5FWF6_9SAUR